MAGNLGKDVPAGTLMAILRSAGLEEGRRMDDLHGHLREGAQLVGSLRS